MTIRCGTKEEFIEALVFELESDNPGVIPEDWTGYLSRCLHWRDEGGEDIHAKCADQGDYNSLETDLAEAKEKIEELEKDLEECRSEVETLEDRLLPFEDTDPPPPNLRASARDAVKTLRALLPQLDAAKFTAADRKRVRMSLHYAAQNLETATHKAEDETLPEDHAPEPVTYCKICHGVQFQCTSGVTCGNGHGDAPGYSKSEEAPAAVAWETATCEAEGVTFRWHRTPMRSPKGVQVGITTWIAWTPVEGVAAEVGLSRGWGGTLLATLQVWQDGKEVDLLDLIEGDREILHEQARVLEACLP